MMYYVFDGNIVVYPYRMEKHHFIGYVVIVMTILAVLYSYYYKVVLNLILLIKYVITILMLLQCNIFVYLVYIYMYMYETCGHRHSNICVHCVVYYKGSV